jgi:hypothetical protein
MLVDKTAHGTFMVPLVKFGSSLVSSLWGVRKFGTYYCSRAQAMPVCGLYSDTPLCDCATKTALSMRGGNAVQSADGDMFSTRSYVFL